MPIVNINDVGKYGVITPSDLAARHIPLGAWTYAENVAFRGTHIAPATSLWEKDSARFDPAMGIKHIFSVLAADGETWVFCGEDAVYASFGSTATDGVISGATAPYNAAEWNGGVFNNLLVINPIAISSNPVMGVGAPQLWSPTTIATALVNLTNWPANYKCRCIRPFKTYLVAMGIQKPAGPTNYVRMVKWSHSADTGVPSSWDETNPTLDAGENNLPYGSTPIVDGLDLGEAFVIYTEEETWMMYLSNEGDIFKFRRMFSDSGLIAQDCAVALFPGKHLAVTQNDIILHDLYNRESVIDNRIRNWFFDNVGVAPYYCRMAVDRIHKEVWIGYPLTSDPTLSQALVWNYKFDTWTKRDIPVGNAVFSSQTSMLPLVRGRRSGSIVIGAAATPYVYQTNPEVANQYLQDATLEKEDVCVLAGPRGEPVIDPNGMKLIRAIWPRFKRHDSSSVVTVAIATRDHEAGSWVSAGSAAYSPTTSEKVDIYATGRFFKITMTVSFNVGTWQLQSYGIDVEPLGGR